MNESALDMVQRMLKEGRTTEQIRSALSGRPYDEPSMPLVDNAPEPYRANSSVAPPPAGQSTILDSPAADAEAGSKVVKPSVPDIILRPYNRLAPVLRPHSGWISIVLLCLIPVLVLSFDRPDQYLGLSNSLLTLGDITGVLGVTLYVAGLVLSTRSRHIERMFGGLNRVYVSHAIVGSTSLVAVLIHPFFAASSYYQYGLRVVAHFFIPQIGYLGTAFGIFALIAMASLLVLTLFVKLAYKTWLRTHRLLGLVFLLIILHVILTPNHVMSDPVMAVYMYTMLIIGSWAYIYRTLLPDIFVKRYLYTIRSAVPKGIGVVEVNLIPVDKAIHFVPGQFVFLAFNNDALAKEWHPFSVSSGGSQDRLMLDIRSLGSYTETLTRLLPYMVGMTVRVEGAYGRFSFRNYGNVNQVWIAGGIGITPFLSMAQALDDGLYNIDLYYAVKTESELIDLDLLAAHQSRKSGQVFRVFPYIADRYNAHLSADFIAQNTGNLKSHDFLLCGPPGMMRSLSSQLKKMGVSEGQIHSEEFAL